ncbi:hypothetical protein GCM10007320_43610 [Pseudorhodoferax aquiterrae]|uniref:DUF2946 domain-containing protein n=1 Tax=Pseudorhodoferax aquiterrae TaxID=747304 RepID=A0ABQ3G786_9BURK|nr:hypothetical protein GCM10007320_43610 [Pseudorhodoferax aquiterrae]
MRRSTTLARTVLLWFVLALGVAIAAPVVQPQAMELICTASGGAKLVVLGEDGDQDIVVSHHSIECPMCLAVTLPPAPQTPRDEPVQPLAHALQPVVAAHIAALVGAPLPPRGPPSIS